MKNASKKTAKLRPSPHPIQPLATLVKTDARGSVGEGGRFNFFLFHFIYNGTKRCAPSQLMRKLNRLATKATEYTGHVISLLASENAGKGGGF